MYKISFKNIGINNESFEIKTDTIDLKAITKAIEPYISSVYELDLSADKEGEYALMARKGFKYLGEYKIEKVI